MATRGALTPSRPTYPTQSQGYHAETESDLPLEGGLLWQGDMKSRCAALVEELLMQISEPSQREKFVTEMNNLPWRYLDWHDVNLSDLMSRMAMDDRDQQNRETTLVYSDSEAAMRKRIDEYSHESLSWTFISCPTTISHMTKRIAIGEGDNNVRMIRMLDLSETGDAHNDRLGEFNVVESSDNSEANKTSYAVFDAPDEQYAIAHDDEKLMKWTFDLKKAGGEDVRDIIQYQDAKGKNLYHQCAIADSPSILKYFRTLLSKARLLAILQAEDENGDTPIHLATLHKSAAAMHQLLSPLDRTRLDQLLNRNNKKQQTALKMVQNDINNIEIKPLIEYHRQLREEDQLMDFFDTFRYSLFSYELNPKRETIVLDRVEHLRPVSDPGAQRNVNMDAATCLFMNDIDKAKVLIDRASEIVPDDVHTWCNKGKYALLVDDRRKAKDAAFQVLNLLTNKSGLPKLKAKIEYAYFIAEASRDDKAREESVGIFKECMTELEQFEDPIMTDLKAYCSYHYAKILVRNLKYNVRFEKSDENIRDMLHRAFDQLAFLSDWAKATDSAEYTAEMWLWLAEVQFLHLSDVDKATELEEFKQRTGHRDIKPETCLKKATEIAVNHEDKVESKIKVHIARNFLHLAYETYDKERRLYFLNRAQKDCEWWIENFYWTFESANTCAQALWLQWCTEIYFRCKELVRETFTCIKGRWKTIKSDSIGMDFVTREFYHPRIKSDHVPLSITNKYLPGAMAHLKTVMEKPDGWAYNGVKYAKVMFILDQYDNHQQEIKEAYKKAYDAVEPGTRRIKVAEECGLYYAWIGRHDEAGERFNQAIQEYEDQTNEKKYRPRRAIDGFELLKYGGQFFRPEW